MTPAVTHCFPAVTGRGGPGRPAARGRMDCGQLEREVRGEVAGDDDAEQKQTVRDDLWGLRVLVTWCIRKEREQNQETRKIVGDQLKRSDKQPTGTPH